MLYRSIRYPKLDVCQKACTEMDIRTTNIAREKEWRYNHVEFVFRKKITVSREVLSVTLLSLVAEVGYRGFQDDRLVPLSRTQPLHYIILRLAICDVFNFPDLSILDQETWLYWTQIEDNRRNIITVLSRTNHIYDISSHGPN